MLHDTGEIASPSITIEGTPEQRAVLFTKMAKVLHAITRVPKEGFNSFHRYAYATETDLMDVIRPLLAEAGIVVFFSVSGVERIDMGDSRNGPLTRTHMTATFCCGESGAVVTVGWCGDGQDPADKGLYKSYTGAVKYLLMKTFLVSTGDDPERDGDDPRSPQSTRQRQPEQPARPASPPTPAARPAPVANAPASAPGVAQQPRGVSAGTPARETAAPPPARREPVAPATAALSDRPKGTAPLANTSGPAPDQPGQRYVCSNCNQTIYALSHEGRRYSPKEWADYTVLHHDRALCGNCERLAVIDQQVQQGQGGGAMAGVNDRLEGI